MPKIKTKKSVVKRITNITPEGKILHRTLSAQHLTKGKSKRTLSKANKKASFTKAQVKKIKNLVITK